MPQLIEKRNGAFEAWDPAKINFAIEKAFLASNKTTGNVSYITDLVLKSINGAKSIKVEAVQNIIEQILMSSGYADVAKNFILYREKRREIRDVDAVMLDVTKTITSYIGEEDWRVNENANAGKSYPGLTLNINSSVQAAYWLNKLPEAIRLAHTDGFLHLHDLGNSLCGYCSGWSLYDIILEGFNLPEQCSSGPSKHFDTILSQIINFIGTLQNEWSGAQALSNFDTLVAPFIYYDKLSLEKELGIELTEQYLYKKVKQSMQRFVFNINTTSRWGGQTPFSNLTFDLVCPKHYADMPVIVGGEAKDKTYKEFDYERMLVNKAFLEVMMEGDYNHRVFTFPIPTYNITPDFPWESEIGKMLLEMTAKYGAPYFQNFINSDLRPEDVRSMCPLAADTQIRVKDKNGIDQVLTIEDIHRRTTNGEKFLTYYNGGWHESSTNTQVDKTITVELNNGYKVEMGTQHLQPITRNGVEITVKASELIVGDELPLNTLDCNSDSNTYKYGKLLGYYLLMDNTENYLKALSTSKYVENIKSIVSDIFEGVENFEEFNLLDTEDYIIAVKDNIIEPIESSNPTIVFAKHQDIRLGISDTLKMLLLDKFLIIKDKETAGTIISILASVGKYISISEVNGEYAVEDYTDTKVAIKNLTNNTQEKNLYCFEVNTKEQLFTLANGVVTHNCRLQLDKNELKEHLSKLTNKGNGLFGAGELTGSVGVVTINLPKLAYLSKDKEDKKQAFFDLVLHTATLAKTSLELKRKMLNNNLEKGMYPWSKRYLKHGLNAHFSTIGVIGGHEACLNLLGVGIDSTEGKQLMIDTLNLLRDKIKEFQKETGNLYNLEATPGEGTSYRLAKLDKKNHPDIITAGEDVPFYTNSTHLPVDYTHDPIAALTHQDGLQTLYTGGTVLHLFLGEKATDLKSLKNLIVKALTLTKLPYISITPTFSICTDHGYISGEHFNCPHCGKEAEVYSRIVGYLRPVSRWGKGKKEEFKLRTEYRMVD